MRKRYKIRELQEIENTTNTTDEMNIIMCVQEILDFNILSRTKLIKLMPKNNKDMFNEDFIFSNYISILQNKYGIEIVRVAKQSLLKQLTK